MRRAEAGFALIEVLVALAVTAVLLVSIGQVASVSITGARTASERAALGQTARQLLAELSLKPDLTPGISQGTNRRIAWRIEITPRPAPDPAQPGGWAAVDVTARLKVPSGRSGEGIAIFRDRSGGMPFRLRRGGEWQGWILEKLERRTVVVNRSGRAWELALPETSPAAGRP